MFKKLKQEVKTLKEDTKQELWETKIAAKLIWERRKRELTDEEELQVKLQSLDVLKLLVLSGLFIIPGSGIIIIILIKFGKKVGIKVLPSSFENKNNETSN